LYLESCGQTPGSIQFQYRKLNIMRILISSQRRAKKQRWAVAHYAAEITASPGMSEQSAG